MMRYSERSKNKWKKEEVWTLDRRKTISLPFGLVTKPVRCGAVIFKHVRRNPRISSLLIQRTTTFLKLFFRDG